MKIIPKEDMSLDGEIYDRTSIAGIAGRRKHTRSYKTEGLHRHLTIMVADILRETEEVKMYREYHLGHNDKYFDLRTEKYGKAKHIYSIGRIKKPLSVIYYEYQIPRCIRRANNYILTAFIEDDENIIIPKHFWIIKRDEKIKTERTNIEFCERTTFTVYETDVSILKMKKYEDNDKLEKMQTVDIYRLRNSSLVV